LGNPGSGATSGGSGGSAPTASIANTTTIVTPRAPISYTLGIGSDTGSLSIQWTRQ
jgi:hypothetical protein